MTQPGVRGRAERRRDTLRRLAHDVDVWVASAGPGGAPYLVPLSYLWTGTELLLATSRGNPTGRNLRETGTVRLALDGTRDVVLIDGTVTMVGPDALPAELADAFAAHTGFEPRRLPTHAYFRVRPDTVQVWREVDEFTDRYLMRAGRWLDD